jgi:hypothetical protein
MPTSTSRLSYPDCESFLNIALEDEKGARLPFPREGQANQFRVRLNYFRTLVRNDNAKVHPEKDHPMHGRCEYDVLQFTVVPDDAGEWWVYARINQINEAEVERLSDIEG